MRTKLLTLALAALTIGLLGSCKKEDYKVSVTGVTLDKTELTLTVGDSDVKLTATVAPDDATDKSVSWSSDKTDVATVDNQGNVHAIAPGTATITVTTTDGDKTAPCEVTVKAALPAGALSAEFTVNAEGKKVHFSKGNLYADGNKALHFEDKQDSYADSWDASHVSHFTWSSTVADAVSTSNGGNYLFCDESHKVSVDGSEAIYYNLTKDEWNYLLNFRTVRGGTGREYSYVGWVTYMDKTGMILYPDNYNGSVYRLGNILDSLPEGVVFLPATGTRTGTTVANADDINYLTYWTTSIYPVNGDFSHTIIFDFSFIMPAATRHYVGHSIRLVTDVK